MMRILAIKMSIDPKSCKVAYSKDGILYIRNGSDDFAVGVKCEFRTKSLVDKWGFSEIKNPPDMKNGKQILRNLNKFQLDSTGKVSFIGG